MIASAIENKPPPPIPCIARKRINSGIFWLKPQSADFTVPDDFDLRDHARSRQAWELGDADGIDAVVEFVVQTGAAAPWMQLGAPVAGRPAQRSYRVRSLDRFVRWLMSLAGAARPVSPPELVEAYRGALNAALRCYEGGA